MARILTIEGVTEIALDSGWQMAVCEAGACPTPAEAAFLGDWLPATVPGTAAKALIDAGRMTLDAPISLHDKDVWWRVDIEAAGAYHLCFEGIATLAEVWLEGVRIGTSKSMYLPLVLPVDLSRPATLWLCCRSLSETFAQKLPRARWKTRMIPQAGLRGVRTTLLGQAPGWMPSVDAVGPWRPVRLLPVPVIDEPWVLASLEADGTGRLSVRMKAPGAEKVIVRCAGQEQALTVAEDGGFSGDLVLAGIRPWWPHTHGEPVLYDVALIVDGKAINLGRTGFRHIERTHGADGQGFGLLINGVPVFCRGACWTSSDITGLSGDKDSYRPWLELARDGGSNMIRMSGTGAYESSHFYEICDELGVMVFQDFMFANFDYPAGDPEFAALVRAEADAFLSRVQLSPSLAILCGGSEMYQQATMMGVAPANATNALCDEILPKAVTRLRPDAPYVANSPLGDPLPFSTGRAVTHYFGVGAYMRPLEDARRADVRFATECLAFANIPNDESLRDRLVGMAPGDEAWKSRTPRDAGADWDFEDVRDHYLERLHGVEAPALRRNDPAKYIDLSREMIGQVMAATINEWRRPGSNCQGALVWTLQDFVPGAGWGLIDSFGRPKSVWYALRRAWQPLHLGLTDEGCDGLGVHIINETQNSETLEVELTCLKGGVTPVFVRKKALELSAGEAISLSAYEIIGSFFDLTYAYRFGPRGHDATIVRLRRQGSDEVLSECVHYPAGADYADPEAINAVLMPLEAHNWRLEITAGQLVRGVFIDVPGFQPDDDGFDLTPAIGRSLILKPVGQTRAVPAGQVRSRGKVLASF